MDPESNKADGKDFQADSEESACFRSPSEKRSPI